MHSAPNSLKFRYFGPIRIALAALFFTAAIEVAPAAEPLPYAEHFNPANGFKPAQRNLTAIFLQMAGSFEHYGTPANYLRHVNNEAKRVETAWLKAMGKPATFRPGYFTEGYIEKLITGWNQMAPALALESFSRNSGRHMRCAIMGSWNMTPAEVATSETKLTKVQSGEFQRLLAKPFFTKSDFPALEKFYADGAAYDKLSDQAKGELSKRIWRGTLPTDQRDKDIRSSEGGTIILALLQEHQTKIVEGINGKGDLVNADDLRKALALRLELDGKDLDSEKLPSVERDAIIYSHAIKVNAERRLKEVSKQATPEQMEAMESAMRLMYENLIVAAQLEFEIGLWDEVLKH